jgi:thiol-disulfide isomerase/thioredoxin
MTSSPVARVTSIVAALVAAVAWSACTTRHTASLAGRWDATVVVNGVEIPAAFEIAGEGAGMTGSFFNSSLRIVSTATVIEDDAVTFAYDQYGTRLRLVVKDDQLEGEYLRAAGPYAFRARRAVARTAPGSSVPTIDGVWIVKARGSKGEEAWRFVARQTGADVEATILRIDGDTGALTGSFDGRRFVLSHFDGSRPLLLEVAANADGTLTLVENKGMESVAVRESTTAAGAIGTPEDPALHTTMRDGGEPFRFSFRDLDGRIVSNTDPKFAGKVLLVSISGSWCPNCHDEAPFLVSLYKKYRAQGLEIVSLSFERAGQLENPVQLRAFMKTYGIEYTVLVPGEPGKVTELLPQAVNLDCFPTSFILDRDGRVQRIHAGFPSPGSGAFYDEAVAEITGTIERLLAGETVQPGVSSVRSSRPPRVTLAPAVTSSPAGSSDVGLSLTVTMPREYHVQAHEPRDPSLIPTILDVEVPEGATVLGVKYPKPQEFSLAGSNDVLLVYGPTFTIDVRLRLPATAAAGDVRVPAVLRYQACDDAVCFAPARATAEWSVRVGKRE